MPAIFALVRGCLFFLCGIRRSYSPQCDESFTHYTSRFIVTYFIQSLCTATSNNRLYLYVKWW